MEGGEGYVWGKFIAIVDDVGVVVVNVGLGRVGHYMGEGCDIIHWLQ